MNFHGLGRRDTSPNGAARRTASMAICIVSLAWRGSRRTSMRRTLPSRVELDLEHRDRQQRIGHRPV